MVTTCIYTGKSGRPVTTSLCLVCNDYAAEIGCAMDTNTTRIIFNLLASLQYQGA